MIQDDEHLLVVLRYIEANPLRAGLVSDRRDYRRSSYAVHGLGEADDSLSELPGWEALAATPEDRQARWRAWVQAPLMARELAAVRQSVTTGRPFGSPGWVEVQA